MSVVLQAISLEAVNLLVHGLDPIVVTKLLVFELFNHLVFARQFIFYFINDLRFSVSFSLEDSESANGIRPDRICASKPALDVLVIVSLAHDVDLEVTIHLVCHVLTVDLALHMHDILLAHVILLDQVSSISIYSVKFLEDKIESALQRLVVVVQLIQIVLRRYPVRII